MNLGKVAIVKPDHLGDLVLATPAVRVLTERLGTVDLFVNQGLANFATFLFGPQQNVKEVGFAHIDKKANTRHNNEFANILGYDTLIFLREDNIINFSNLRGFAKNLFFVTNQDSLHETELQKKLVEKLVGDYEPELYFGLIRQIDLRHPIKHIGLCIAAGHSSNSWPLNYWAKIGFFLIAEGFEISLIGGPQEEVEMRYLAKLWQLPSRQIIRGDSNFQAFIDKLSLCDFIIANDSGTAHISSMVRPIFSIFGPSPHLRFRPFGKYNQVLTKNLICSPCLQFSKNHINLCVSRECMVSLTPDYVFERLKIYMNYLVSTTIKLV